MFPKKKKNIYLILVSSKDDILRYHVVRFVIDSEYNFGVVPEPVGKFEPKSFKGLGSGCIWICCITDYLWNWVWEMNVTNSKVIDLHFQRMAAEMDHCCVLDLEEIFLKKGGVSEGGKAYPYLM